MKLEKLKPKSRAFKTDENQIKTSRIAAMLLWFVFLWRLKVYKSDVLKVRVGLSLLLSEFDRYFDNIAFAF